MNDTATVPHWKGWLGDLSELIKTRLTFMNLLMTLAGFYVGSAHEVGLPRMLVWHTLFGTALVASAASALNQLLERDHDLRMERTASRPLAARRWNADHVLIGSMIAGVGGLIYLALFTNLLVSVLAAATLASYVFVYTPLKRVTNLNTFVGAIPGALPPVIGYAAATERIGLEGALLFAILFFWQLPHFLAIAWIYRNEYKEAGFKMLSGDDPSAAQTSRQAFFTSTALLPVALLPAVLGIAGMLYFVSAFVLGIAFCWKAWQFYRKRTDASARQLFIASIIYLPLLLGLLAYDSIRG